MNEISLRRYLKLMAYCSVLLSFEVNAAPFPVGTQLLPLAPRVRFPLQNTDTGLTVEHKKSQHVDSTDTVFIRKIKIADNMVFDSQKLHSLVADGEGKKLNLAQINELAMRISHYYQQNGYLVSRAYIPQQSIENGVLYINIEEARLGKVKVKNTSRLTPYRVNTVLSGLEPNQLLTSASLDRSLLLLGDLPGIKTRSVLAPGEQTGSSDLLVTVEPAPLLIGVAGIDNYGSKYIGQVRYNAVLQINNPTGQGDQILFQGVTTGRNMSSGRVGYRFPIAAQTSVGADFSGMTYKLKGNLSDLDANGNQTSGDLWASHIWLRDINTNINSTVTYTHTNIDDKIEAVEVAKARHTNKVVISQSAEIADSHGRTSIYLSGTFGNLSFDNAGRGGQVDADGPKTSGGFAKGSLHISRLQQFGYDTSLYLGFDGQIASKNLDSSEQLTLGGPFSVRSYNVGAISGSQGYFATAELRHVVSDSLQTGQWMPMIFVDAGHIQVYKEQFVQEENSVNLASIGIGLDISWKDWSVSSRYAHRLGAAPASTLIGDVDDNKFWVQVSRSF